MERLLTLLFELEINRQQNVENKQIGSFNSLLTWWNVWNLNKREEK